MKKLQKLLIVALLYLSIVPVILADCVLKMAYKEGDKIPLIAKMPDNSGAYFDLFDTAAKKIGCRLEVVRLPKKGYMRNWQKVNWIFTQAHLFRKREQSISITWKMVF